MSLSVHESIGESVSDILHSMIHDLDGSDPEELVQCVTDALNDFITDLPVVTVRIVVTEDGLIVPEVYTSN